MMTAAWEAIALFIIYFSVFPSSTTPFASTIFFVWCIYDVTRAQQSNKHILVASPYQNINLSLYGNENPEKDWGVWPASAAFLAHSTASADC